MENIEDIKPDIQTETNIYYGCFNMFVGNEGKLPSQIPLLDEQILSLNKLSTKYTQFDFIIPLDVNRIVIAYPYDMGPIQCIIDKNSFDFNIEVAFKHKTRDLFINGKISKYYVYHLDYAFLNQIVNIYKVKIKK